MGDLLINEVVNPHAVFQRQGYDMMAVTSLPFQNVVQAVSVDLKTYGPVELKVDKGTKRVIKKDSQDSG